jgi:hypothetical protein
MNSSIYTAEKYDEHACRLHVDKSGTHVQQANKTAI